MYVTTALDVANALIAKSHSVSSPISHMKLQKLVYFAFGWYGAITKQNLFEDEIQAWKFGPVVPDLYHRFKLYYLNPIPLNHFFASGSRLNPELLPLINKIWEVYGHFSAEELVNKTHEVGTPWHQAWFSPHNSYGSSNIAIDKASIRQHFEQLLAN